MAVDPRWREQQEVARAASGSAGELIPALARVVKTGSWREFIHPTRGVQRYERFADYCEGFVRISPEAVRALLDRTGCREAARAVKEMLVEQVEPQPRNGEIGNGRRCDNVTPTDRGNSAKYLLRRLQRDRPDLVQKVARGEIRSARAAAIEAGIVKVPTGLVMLRRAWAKATEDERRTFMSELA